MHVRDFNNSLEYFKALDCKISDFIISILVVQQLHGSLRSKLLPVFKHHIHLRVKERGGGRRVSELTTTREEV